MSAGSNTSSSMHDARYLVGIDLGTTHTVVAYADLRGGGDPAIHPFTIEQLVAPGEVAARPLLPSVRYHPAAGELSPGDLVLPWTPPDGARKVDAVLGDWAVALGAKSYGRLVTSAKSWLSHPTIDRTAAVLPWGASDGVLKVSPVEACGSYMAYVRSAWNYQFRDDPLEQQDVVVTVPASFDDGARALTLRAAEQAGLPHVRLVEEPQAAVYDWLWQHRSVLRAELSGVRLVLVCDVGGGTTDFTLIRIDEGRDVPVLTRVGVGNHLMLGGDNIDLALAHWVEEQIGGKGRHLGAAELSQLVAQCRRAKETLLATTAPETAGVTLLGSGSRLVGGARSVSMERTLVQTRVLDGFLPYVSSDEFPVTRRSGMVEFGLPYAADPAISRHLAWFLSQHHQVLTEGLGVEGARLMPDAVLLNGGVFRSELFAQRLMALLRSWGGDEPKRLANDRPEQAVAFGAVAYGLARRGIAISKIQGGSARSYFLSIGTEEGEQASRGVCVLPRGTEEGVEITLRERRFRLKLGEPVRFHLYCSTADTIIRPGDLIALDSTELIELPPLAVVLDEARTDAVVLLTAEMSEWGTLALHCVAESDEARRWRLEFQLRSDTAGLSSAPCSHPRAGEAQDQIRLVFGKKVKSLDARAVKGLRGTLEKILGGRDQWDTSLCRDLFAVLLEGLPHRRRSPDHERVWLNLTGFCLRPGFGDSVDDWRVRQVWALFPQGIQFVNESQNWAEWWTLWRRIAGGLSPEAQATLFEEIGRYIDPDGARRGNLATQARKRGYEDMVRLAASLERLSPARKVQLGSWLLERLQKPGEPHESWWALGRVGSRVPLHGSAHGVVPRDVAESWLSSLFPLDWRKSPAIGFAATLIARKSGDRERDVGAEIEQGVITRLRSSKAPDSWIRLVSEVQSLDAAEERRVFGEGLPPGLTLMS